MFQSQKSFLMTAQGEQRLIAVNVTCMKKYKDVANHERSYYLTANHRNFYNFTNNTTCIEVPL